MAQNETNITVVGTMVADPELRFTPAGAAVANFRIASNPRQFNKQTNQWEDLPALFLPCTIWRQAAENVAESLQKGMRVIVTGRLRQRSFQTREGENRTVMEVEVDEVGPSLTFATAQVTRNPHQGGTRGQSGQQPGNNSATPQTGTQGGFSGQAENDPWNTSPPTGGFNGDDEPPF